MGTPSIHKAAALAIDTAGTAIGSYSNQLEFVSITPGGGVALVDTNEEATRGSRDPAKERVVQGLITTELQIVMNPTPAELDILLPWIGFSESTDTFSLTETLTYRDILIDFDVHRQIFQDCLVNTAEFSSTKGQPLKLTLNVLCRTQDTPVATAFPTIGIDTEAPYMHHQGVLTLRSASREYTEVSLTIDNQLVAEHNNAQEPTVIFPTGRMISGSCNTPFSGDEDDLYTAPLAAVAGAAGTLVYTNGGQSTTFTLANVKEDNVKPPAITGGEIRQAIDFKVFSSGSTASLVITHDATA